MPPAPTLPDDPVPMEPMTLRASPSRRVFALVTQAGLGLLLLWVALAHPPQAPAWGVGLLALGAGVLWLTIRAWRGSAQAIVLDAGGLRREDGTPIAPIGNLVAVDRALFAMKPSNGFVARLDAPMAGAWVPGLYWRIGRRVGIGGITGGAETKLMADTLAVMIDRKAAMR